MKNFREVTRSIAEIGAVLLLFSHYYPLSHYIPFWPLPADSDHIFEFWMWVVTAIVFAAGAGTNAILVWNKEKLLRKARFAFVIPEINNAYADIHQVLSDEKSSAKECRAALEKFCDNLSAAFTRIIGSHCHICIKAITQKDNQLATRTLVREKLRIPSKLHANRHGFDKKSGPALIAENTDFYEITNNINNKEGEKYFFCNSLPKKQKRGEYLNSSFLHYKMTLKGPEKKKFLWVFKKRQKWPLKYKSTIVAPICLSIDNPESEDPIHGFLCVDHESQNVFDETTDIDLLIGCANGLFNVLERYNEKLGGN